MSIFSQLPLRADAIVACAAAMICFGPAAAAQDHSTRIFQALGLTDASVVSIATQDHVPGNRFTRAIAIGGMNYVVEMQPHSVRSQNFRVRVQIADGSYVQQPRQSTRLMKGQIQGLPGSRVVGSVNESGLMAKIVMPDGQAFVIEPIAARVAGVNIDDHVIYRPSDVIPVDRACGVIDPQTLRRQLVERPSNRRGGEFPTQPLGVAAGSIIQIAELAIDTDVEFFNFFGSVQATLDRIELVVGITNDQYETQTFLTHELSEVIIRSAEPDPYSSFNAFTLLDQFVAHWLNEQQDVQRDVAHLFTGKDLGGIGGVAFLSGLCTPDNGFGLDRIDFNGQLVCSTDLLAHELGHNWSANHCNCPNNTMNAGLTCTNVFTTASVNAITNFANSLDCLDVQTDILLGDVNLDGVVNLLDVQPFVMLLGDGGFQLEADINGDGAVNLLDVQLFVDLLGSN